jgi:2-amino-4-hydroxy-6-hydroxymethyldihydropteridine diphosphokinase/dihydropteroate synthase
MDEGLKIPYPELCHRPFLMYLMATLQNDWRFPVPGMPYSHLTLNEILHTYVALTPPPLNAFAPFPQIVDIVNVTPDSFSDGDCYLGEEKIFRRIQDLSNQGAAVIDIGDQSTRPGAKLVSAEEEWKRLGPAFELLAYHFKSRAAKPQISLDSYYPEVIRKALQLYPIDWLNDVTGGENADIIRTLLNQDARSSLPIPYLSLREIA